MVGVLAGIDARLIKSPAAIDTDAVAEQVVAVSEMSHVSAELAPATRRAIVNFFPDPPVPGADRAKQLMSVAVTANGANICAMPSVEADIGDIGPAKRLELALGEGMPVIHQSVAHAGDANSMAIMRGRIRRSICLPMSWDCWPGPTSYLPGYLP